MGETGEKIREKQPSRKSTLVKVFGALVLNSAMTAGLGQEPRAAEADSPTPSPTPIPVGTPTPDALATQIAEQKAKNARLAEELRQAEEQAKKKKELVDAQATSTAITGQLNVSRGTPIPPTATPTSSGEEARLKRIDEAVVKELADRQAAADTTLAERQAKLKKLDEAIERVNQRLADRELEADAAAERRLTADTNIQDVAVRIGAGVTGGFLGGLLVGRLWGGIRRRIGGVVRGIFRRGGGGTPPAGPHDPLGTI